MHFRMPVYLLIALSLVACAASVPPSSALLPSAPTGRSAEPSPSVTTAASPTPRTGAASATLVPSATPSVCVEAATPLVLPPRTTPLEVHFISGGNIWLWHEGDSEPRRLTETSDACCLSLSPDGQVFAFARVRYSVGQDQLIERYSLWAVNHDGSHLRRLISEDDVQAMGSHPLAAGNRVAISRWLPNTHALTFFISPIIYAIGDDEPYGEWSLDVDTLTLTRLPQPTREKLRGLLSPDGQHIAYAADYAIGVANADGSNRRDHLVSFPYIGLGHYAFEPSLFWSRDSQWLRTVIPSAEPFAADAEFSTWLIAADGSSAQRLATFSGFGLDVKLSPNQRYITFWKPMGDQPRDRELHLARFDGTRDVIYERHYVGDVLGWAPDSIHFVYRRGPATHEPTLLGVICGDAVPLADAPANHVEWIDSRRFLFLTEEHRPFITAAATRQLRLSSIGEPSILISEVSADVEFDFNREPAAVGEAP